jgi:hypothetical protein
MRIIASGPRVASPRAIAVDGARVFFEAAGDAVWSTTTTGLDLRILLPPGDDQRHEASTVQAAGGHVVTLARDGSLALTELDGSRRILDGGPYSAFVAAPELVFALRARYGEPLELVAVPYAKNAPETLVTLDADVDAAQLALSDGFVHVVPWRVKKGGGKSALRVARSDGAIERWPGFGFVWSGTNGAVISDGTTMVRFRDDATIAEPFAPEPPLFARAVADDDATWVAAIDRFVRVAWDGSQRVIADHLLDAFAIAVDDHCVYVGTRSSVVRYPK